jgi:hypothetical protein
MLEKLEERHDHVPPFSETLGTARRAKMSYQASSMTSRKNLATIRSWIADIFYETLRIQDSPTSGGTTLSETISTDCFTPYTMPINLSYKFNC